MKKILNKFLISAIFMLVPAIVSAASAPAQPSPATQHDAPDWTLISASARPSMAGSSNTAAYISLHNASNSDITIIGAKAMSVANRVELHTTTDTNGVMQMVKVDRLVIPAGSDLIMKQGGVHIMLLDLKKALKDGDQITITLISKELGIIPVPVKVAN